MENSNTLIVALLVNLSPFTELEGSLPPSQEPATGSYPEPNESNQHITTITSLRFMLILLSHLSLELALSSKISDQNFVCISHLYHACHVPRPFHPS
jgi:hypothetical protein